MITYEDFRDKRREYAFTKSVSKDPKDQDDARKIRVQMDYDDLKKQIGSKKKPQVPANAVVEVVLEKDLNAAERRALPDKEFALPGKGKGPEGKQAGSYPIPDATHARAALAMVAKYGTPEEKEKVRAAVRRKFPDIQQEAKKNPNNLVEPSDGVDSAKEVNKATRKAAFRPFHKEDKALAAVRASIEKEHGKGAIYDPKKKQSPADKAKVAAARKKRQDSDNKAFAGRAKKAGYKNPQDYANVVARYGSEDNMKKGRGLGT